MAGESAAIRAGRAFVELFTTDVQLEKGLKAAEKRMKSWAKGMAKVGASIGAAGGAIVAPIAGAAVSFVDMGSELGKLSIRTGIQVEQLSGLAYAAKRSGIEVDGLEVGIKKMQKAIYDVGAKGGHDPFKALGLSAKELAGLNPEEQLLRIVDALAAVTDETTKSALAVAVFGKAGTQFKQLAAKGSEGLRELTEAGKRFGVVMSEDDVKAAKEFRGVMKDLQASFMGVSIAIGRAVVPAMTRLRETILPAVKQISEMIRNNAALADKLFDIGTGIVVAGTAIVTLAGAVKIGAMAIGAIAAAITFAMSPFGAFVVTLGALTEAFVLLTDQGKNTQAAFVYTFGAMAETFKSTWGGILAALRSGDLELTGKIAMAGLNLAWLQGINVLKASWTNFSAFMRDSFENAILGVRLIFDNMVGRLVKGMIIAKEAIKGGNPMAAARRAIPQLEEIDRLVGGGRENAINERDRKARDIERRRQGLIAGFEQTEEFRNAKAELDRLNQEAANKPAEAVKGQIRGVARGGGLGPTGESVGTFNPLAAQRLGAGSDRLQEQVDQQKKTNELLEEVKSAVLGIGPVFV